MSNLSILEQNIVLSIEGCAGGEGHLCDEAQAIFLRWKDRDVLKAERAAYEWARHIAPFLRFALTAAAEGHRQNPHGVLTPEQTVAAVTEFIKERHVRRYFPNH